LEYGVRQVFAKCRNTTRHRLDEGFPFSVSLELRALLLVRRKSRLQFVDKPPGAALRMPRARLLEILVEGRPLKEKEHTAMLSSKKKPDIDVQKDGRVILRGVAYAKMKAKLRNLADSRCENCGHGTVDGDVHHPSGRGGGKRDDRIYVDGKRNLFYWCRSCHSGHHVPEKVVPAKMSDQDFETMLGIGG
jgi:hypothetical protein